MVPALSMIFMSISAVLSIALPIGLFLVLRKKYELRVVPMLVGAVAFFVFAMILEQIMHVLVLQPDVDGGIALRNNNPLLYVLYGIFAAGIFEETARLLSFVLLKKKYKGIGTGLSYGIGHGGIEAILLVGLTMLSNLVISAMVNAGAADLFGSVPQMEAQIAALINTDSYLFLVGFLERIPAVAAHVSLSLLVWCAVNRKDKRWLFPVAILFHAILNTPAAMMQAGLITSILFVEGATLILAAALVAIAVAVCNSLKKDDAVSE